MGLQISGRGVSYKVREARRAKEQRRALLRLEQQVVLIEVCVIERSSFPPLTVPINNSARPESGRSHASRRRSRNSSLGATTVMLNGLPISFKVFFTVTNSRSCENAVKAKKLRSIVSSVFN